MGPRAASFVMAVAMAAVACAALAAHVAAPRTHSFLRIDGVLGASNDPGHLGWFDVAGWGPARSTPDGGAEARIRIVGQPPGDLAAAVASHKKLHEALLQDVEVPGGSLVRNVSFWQFTIANLQPAGSAYAVTLRATKVVCQEQSDPSQDRGPCAELNAARR